MVSCGSFTKWTAGTLSVLVLVVAVGVAMVQRTVWWAGYDLKNCVGCEPKIDWSFSMARPVQKDAISQFERDGVVILAGMLEESQVEDLADEVTDRVSNTIMTDGLARFTLPHYLKYEHRLDTRSELVRDWAVHGPFGQWASQLLNASSVRLYNAEAIFHQGSDSPTPCKPAWHRDTIAAPFDPSVRSITFNVYLDPIGSDGPHGDALIYLAGSHKSFDHHHKELNENGEEDESDWVQPNLRVGDVLAHDANVYHTPSGKGCWKRRSLQFRYVAVDESTTFSFGPNRLPHGPIPWTLAHSPGIAPHGLKDGDAFGGPWYPQVYPAPLVEEHVPFGTGTAPAIAWSVRRVLQLAQEAQDTVINPLHPDRPNKGSHAMDGPISDPKDWILQEIIPGSGIQVPCHKHGLFCKNL
jgi:hypothetical protein